MRHIAKEISDRESLRLLGEGFDFMAWEKMPRGQEDQPRLVSGGKKLVCALGLLAENGVLSTKTVGAVSCSRRKGRPRGFAKWDMTLEGAHLPSTIEAPKDNGFVAVIGTFNLSASVFHDRYLELFGCGRSSGSSAYCHELLCPRCWQRTKGAGLKSDVLECINHWLSGPRGDPILGALVLIASEQPDGGGTGRLGR